MVNIDVRDASAFAKMVYSGLQGYAPVRLLREATWQGRKIPYPGQWPAIDHALPAALCHWARFAAANGYACYVVPGAVAAAGQASHGDVRGMATVVVDIDQGDVEASVAWLRRHIGPPTAVVHSGGLTPELLPKRHVWWRCTDAASYTEVERYTNVRAALAAKVAGDPIFGPGRAHQPIRVAGSVHLKGERTLVRTVERAEPLLTLAQFEGLVAAMPPMPNLPARPVPLQANGRRLSARQVVALGTILPRGGSGISRYDAFAIVVGKHIEEHQDDGYTSILQMAHEYVAAHFAPRTGSEAWDAELVRKHTMGLWRRDQRMRHVLQAVALHDVDALVVATKITGAVEDGDEAHARRLWERYAGGINAPRIRQMVQRLADHPDSGGPHLQSAITIVGGDGR